MKMKMKIIFPNEVRANEIENPSMTLARIAIYFSFSLSFFFSVALALARRRSLISPSTETNQSGIGDNLVFVSFFSHTKKCPKFSFCLCFWHIWPASRNENPMMAADCCWLDYEMTSFILDSCN
jgi:hypothetical protein